ncbi:RND family transporter [Motiliproteus coralliicola]|uniref:RND family transporter n=2 Tax=Motiliproteus coralliicola TaxID=2283196 RepID=A0A369WTC6_9GAMM|nr:RND family transporter [Motiliproteus coralliicola]
MHPLKDSEAIVERTLFGHRPLILALCLLMTCVFGYYASNLTMGASFEKMIPTSHPYIANFLENKQEMAGLGNTVRIAVETTGDDIYSAEFQETLKQINDEVFFIPGVDRSGLKSIWTPNVRWTEVTEEGFVGGPVIPSEYDGSDAELDKLRANVAKSGSIGSLVANNHKSAIILAPLYDISPETGEALDYDQFSQRLEALVRDKYESDTVKIHITGFAKVVGDLIEGAGQVATFFAMAIAITLVLLLIYSRSLIGALVPLICSLIAVVWQLGSLRLLGFELDPYSMLVPFLVFAIAISHGVQIVNSTASEIGHGFDKLQAARNAFRMLYVPGFIALLSDGIGFITLMVIDITVIQDLAIAASLGIATIILTNLVILPVVLSYTGVRAAGDHFDLLEKLWKLLQAASRPVPATMITLVAALMVIWGVEYSRDLKIGDLDAGAPELRPDSRYNQDNAFVTSNFATSADLFVVMVKTSDDACVSYDTLTMVEHFQSMINRVPGVQSSFSMVNVAKRGLVGMNEGNLKWAELSRNNFVMNSATAGKHVPPGMVNSDCNFLPIVIYLNDHKAETLTRVADAAADFAAQHNDGSVRFELAAGNAGIEAATNIVIETAQYEMLAWVYGVVGVLVFLTFRSVKTVICIIMPLAMTSVLCQALMTYMGIGVKVATLPVIALGVGIGVDYGIYIYSKLKFYMDQGEPLTDAYLHTLRSTGKAVAFTGLTLAIGVGTWAWSPIKFQADLGVLLTFMFLWNMLGALILLPALARLILRPKELPKAGLEPTS